MSSSDDVPLYRAALHPLDPRSAATRLLLSIGAGAITFFALPTRIDWALRAVASWDAGTTLLLVLAWWIIVRADGEETCRRAAAEDPGRSAVWGIVTVSSLVSLFAAAVALREAKKLGGTSETVLVILALYAVVAAWTLTHTAYTLRYAHLYYGDGSGGSGLTFPGSEQPNDMDFAYFSFCVGICYQVSDVSITSARIRRAVLGHSTLSFAYNTIVLALALNLAFSFLG
ncbi:MAG TPA: DUF1345 domain-containing protein [Byssovorax sp.]|jgi:uncharacterized membrane protein